ncbi:PREDICTED: glycosylphosphatidylinositol anchor attachment 1 protein [Nelumbo nucifera]|uniref:Glycosylphosphatidylinositol anchor attachment 1 protein n=1 Tax=Nelumbo nucifera TaxID=4432 RepID=A0A1U7ZHT8_NELNU|nr:PREDICTED: glycosylphosphatidylinositol anchor attachment 1 protein [Nelumbo nucifera]XP_010251093.1 PREDICTED: glycosylphosphatidylinositol anchor attachment 1 protein [Nelumbo nucifera]XP_010251094.1 PREDICTED: glycosylphosphatidylinositol anchor attachment 1 protein [Nelumbo nucifera]
MKPRMMAGSSGDTKNPKIKPRPIVRIGIFLISHSIVVSLLCFAAGIVALILLPLFAKNTYISENALMPGSANSMLSSQDVKEANKLVKDIIGLKLSSEEARIEIPRLIAQHMADAGSEVYYHKFHPQMSQFYPLHFFSGSPNSGNIKENHSCVSHAINTVGIIRAPRGDGKEAIVLVTPYNSEKVELGEALSLALAYSIFSLLTRVTWLAKDVIWLAADARYGEYASVTAWLRDYHIPQFSALEKLDADICFESGYPHEQNENQIRTDVISRAGTMAAGLVFKVVDKHKETDKDTLSIYAEASNGQMPNLDLINIVNYLAVHRQGLRVKVEKLYFLLDSVFLKIVGDVLETIGKVARSLNARWEFGIPVADYIDGAATLASSMYHQALGVPTGSHGAFRDYQVDAITLEISPKVSLNNEVRILEFLLRGGRLIEGTIRSVNNLLEKFHQSFFLYFLTSPSKFVSVGVYMIAFGLLVVPLPIIAASLYCDANVLDSHCIKEQQKSGPASTNEAGIAFQSWRWLHAAKVVLVIHLWGAIVSLLPYLMYQFPEMTPTTSMLSWGLLSIASLLFLHQILGSPYSCVTVNQSPNREWAVLKSMMIAAAGIGLGLMSIINFATAQIGALLIVPMCLMVHPLKHVYRAGRLRTLAVTACNISLGFIGFPPAAFLFLKAYSEGLGSVSAGDFWNWVESLWAWNSATYLYLGLIHLPCWLLFMYVLLHPC